MPSSTNVNAGDPIKASQYNSLITDMTTIETDMATLETNTNASIANLEAQTALLALQPTVSLQQINWYVSNASGRTFYYNYVNNSQITQTNSMGNLGTREDNGAVSGVCGIDGFDTIKASNAFVWEMSTSINTGCTTQVIWGIADSTSAWNNAIQYGMQGNQPYGYMMFRFTGVDGKLWAVTRASSSDSEEATDLGLASGLTPYTSGQFSLRIHKDNFAPTPGVKYYLNGVLVAEHLNAVGSGNNQYNNFTGGWSMGVCGNNVGATMPSSGGTIYSFYMQNMSVLKQVT